MPKKIPDEIKGKIAKHYAAHTAEDTAREYGVSRQTVYNCGESKKFTKQQIEKAIDLYPQYTKKEIAEKYGVALTTVRRWLENYEKNTTKEEEISKIKHEFAVWYGKIRNGNFTMQDIQDNAVIFEQLGMYGIEIKEDIARTMLDKLVSYTLKSNNTTLKNVFLMSNFFVQLNRVDFAKNYLKQIRIKFSGTNLQLLNEQIGQLPLTQEQEKYQHKTNTGR